MSDIMVGIDPGVNCTGVAFFEGEELKAVTLIERIHEDLGLNIQTQSFELFRWLFGACRYSVIPISIAIEQPRIYPNSRARANDQMDLSAMFGGLISAWTKTVSCSIYTPKKWKGTTPKKTHNARVLEKMPELDGFLLNYPKSKHEHIIDAVGIAVFAMDQKEQKNA